MRKIRDYLRPLDPVAAQRVVDFLLTTAFQLESFPLLGRPGRVEVTREITIPKHPFWSAAGSLHCDDRRQQAAGSAAPLWLTP
ncbi:MAG: type II toxin-antitoxin system RelE/ParE family toxin [Hoeflea sp.]|nr:type II toxin-antitoxin system RelE/ParE family toxin [Hoeflea sp.]